MSKVRIGIDTGGTFTDVVLRVVRTGQLYTYKLLSTPDDPSQAVLDGLLAIVRMALEDSGHHDVAAELSLDTLGEILEAMGAQVVHGSTVATNALLEGKGGKAGLLTTAGFEDVLWIARQNRPELYALQVERTPPPLDREFVVGVAERMAHDGSVLEPLEEEEILRVVDWVEKANLDALSICFLHSYANPLHEAQMASRIQGVLPHLHLTVSHQLLPEFREYERMACCAVNAAIAPAMVSYINTLEDVVGSERLRIMMSHGGSLPPSMVSEMPILTCLSGPAGGVLGASSVMERAGMTHLLNVDMGGTSTDVSLFNNEMVLTQESQIRDMPLRLPMLDIETVGAGGGSIAWLDPGGALQVGPISAGADPGPACYGRQSRPFQPTVTDAHLVLGHLSTDSPLAGELVLQPALAREALQPLAEQMKALIEDVALGILQVAEVSMFRAIQRVTVQRGEDPRDFSLVPFGGAGGLHACRLAEALEMDQVALPTQPGLLSAVGMLEASPKYFFSQALMVTVEAGENQSYPMLRQHKDIQGCLRSLQEKAQQALLREGIPLQEQHIDLSLDLRYQGQSFELSVPWGEDSLPSFLAMHQHLYGYINEGRALEVVAARVEGTVFQDPPVLPELLPREAEVDGPHGVPCQVYDRAGWSEWLRYQRSDLRPGDSLEGPCLIDEYSATTVVPRSWRWVVQPWGQIFLTRLPDLEPGEVESV
ncbi:MAG: hydantoinase/oxoprolinase family protein [Deltaproteobacteria bacterium]|nr:MAG: hydantoinase/oxoprolinase family protein [Deltaproteobacteria bacterium]